MKNSYVESVQTQGTVLNSDGYDFRENSDGRFSRPSTEQQSWDNLVAGKTSSGSGGDIDDARKVDFDWNRRGRGSYIYTRNLSKDPNYFDYLSGEPVKSRGKKRKSWKLKSLVGICLATTCFVVTMVLLNTIPSASAATEIKVDQPKTVQIEAQALNAFDTEDGVKSGATVGKEAEKKGVFEAFCEWLDSLSK